MHFVTYAYKCNQTVAKQRVHKMHMRALSLQWKTADNYCLRVCVWAQRVLLGSIYIGSFSSPINPINSRIPPGHALHGLLTASPPQANIANI